MEHLGRTSLAPLRALWENMVGQAVAHHQEGTVNRLPLPFLLFFLHAPDPVVTAEPIYAALPSYYLPEHRRNNAVRYEAKRWGVPYRIAYAVSHAENYSGDSTARNPRTHALGIMQIHPVNFGTLDHLCYGAGDMTQLRRNACFGMVLLRGYYDQTGSWSAALKLYLGFKNNVQAWMDYTDDIIDHMAGLDD